MLGLGRVLLLGAALLLAGLGFWVYERGRGPPLMPWHTIVPNDLDAAGLDGLDWPGYLAREAEPMDAVYAALAERLPAEARTAVNRYAPESPMYAPRLGRDWNRSFLLEPDRPPRGAVVLLHGLTDAPYSLRHIAEHYRRHGYLALAIRLPGHGTVPAGLTAAERADWIAATRLAVREARARVTPDVPLHLVGYSNGGALALWYALDTLDDPSLPRPSRLVLLSPMLGLGSGARYAGILGWPALFPAFAHAAWIDLRPEYNPFKYNSFPVHAARQAALLSAELADRLRRARADGRLLRLPPILTVQSVADATVSTPAVVEVLYQHLPEQGSELVLIDVDRSPLIAPLLRSARAPPPERLLPPPPRRYAVRILSNAESADGALSEWTTPSGAIAGQARDTALRYPFAVYSLSHVALPFPLHDGLYGLEPTADEDYGIRLGALAVRGERGLLWVSQDELTRIKSNPFFDHLLERLDAWISAEPNAAEDRSAAAAERD